MKYATSSGNTPSYGSTIDSESLSFIQGWAVVCVVHLNRVALNLLRRDGEHSADLFTDLRTPPPPLLDEDRKNEKRV